MSWALGGRVLTGDLVRGLDAYDKAGAVATAAEIRATTTLAKNGGRRVVRAGGLGKLENLIRSEVNPPRGPSYVVTGKVVAKPMKQRRGGLFDIIAEFETGTVITANGSMFLAIANKAVIGRTGRSRTTPADFPAGYLKLVIANGGATGALLLPNGDVAFGLVKRVTIPAKAKGVTEKVASYGAGLDERIVRRWEREAAKAGAKLGIT